MRAAAAPAQRLPEPVAASANRVPAASRKRVAIAAASVVVVGALALGSWLAPQLADEAPQALPAGAKAAQKPASEPTSGPPAVPAVAKRSGAPVTAAALTAPTPPASPVPAADARRPPGDTNIPWLDGTVTPNCVPAANTDAAPSHQELAASQQAYAKGRRLLVQGKLTETLGALCEAARLNPRSSGLAFEVARAALIARDGVTAARFAERSLGLTPPDRRSRELLADALAWQGDVEAARAAWLGIHKLSNPTEKTFRNLALGAVLEARTAAKQGDYATAERYLRRAVAFVPDDAETTTQLGRVLFSAGHYAAAALWIQRALVLDATVAERQVLAGDIQEKLGAREAAHSHYSRALELDPQHALAKLRLRTQTP